MIAAQYPIGGHPYESELQLVGWLVIVGVIVIPLGMLAVELNDRWRRWRRRMGRRLWRAGHYGVYFIDVLDPLHKGWPRRVMYGKFGYGVVADRLKAHRTSIASMRVRGIIWCRNEAAARRLEARVKDRLRRWLIPPDHVTRTAVETYYPEAIAEVDRILGRRRRIVALARHLTRRLTR
jgi:hypothetical protein